MEKDFNNNYASPFMDFNIGYPNMNMGMDMNEMYKDPMLMLQYEQGYCYYRYLCMQMDYKIKCKEYEKMCDSTSNRTTMDRRDNRKIE